MSHVRIGHASQRQGRNRANFQVHDAVKVKFEWFYRQIAICGEQIGQASSNQSSRLHQDLQHLQSKATVERRRCSCTLKSTPRESIRLLHQNNVLSWQFCKLRGRCTASTCQRSPIDKLWILAQRYKQACQFQEFAKRAERGWWAHDRLFTLPRGMNGLSRLSATARAGDDTIKADPEARTHCVRSMVVLEDCGERSFIGLNQSAKVGSPRRRRVAREAFQSQLKTTKLADIAKNPDDFHGKVRALSDVLAFPQLQLLALGCMVVCEIFLSYTKSHRTLG